MVVTDTIADMIARTKNSLEREKPHVDMPSSKLKVEIARILKEEGYIANYKTIEDNKQGILRIFLKYTKSGESVIRDMERVSSPGRRQYVNKEEIPRVMEGLGRAVISTSKGLMTDKGCRKNRLGGEVLLHVW